MALTRAEAIEKIFAATGLRSIPLPGGDEISESDVEELIRAIKSTKFKFPRFCKHTPKRS
ncbi:MAG: hypothetical protein ACUVXI_03455 [bacterium]